jgi:hypothetical protein
MVHRKRQRPRCSSSARVFSGYDGKQTEEQQQQSARCPTITERRRRSHATTKPSAASWRMTMATLLFLLCDNSKDKNGQQTVAYAWRSSNTTAVRTTKKGLLEVVGSCRKEDFRVRAVYLVCDSPGAYYRGSSTYRDSTTCIYGDKARLLVECKSKSIVRYPDLLAVAHQE